MLLFIERLILGGSFFLLFIIGIIILSMKDGFVQSPKIHRYFGISVLMTACAILCIYLDLVSPNNTLIHGGATLVALVSFFVYAFIGYQIFVLFLKKYKVIETEEKLVSMPVEIHENVTAQSKEPVIAETEESDAMDENVDETVEEDDPNATDENGELIPEPSEENMEDLLFFQRLEALMAKKKLFSEQDITREQIAAEIGTNRTYLIRSIKLATGMTFNEYITSLRINYAASLLITTNEPLDLIGTLSGFRSKSTYYRAFQTANNCSPAEYRNRNK